MNTSGQILKALTQIQEYSSLLSHGEEDGLGNLNLAEVHCIDRIGGLQHANVTRIANEMNMTRGAISKISRKLLAKGFIDHFQKDENRKEVYFRLTAQGEKIFKSHKKCHDRARRKKIAVLSAYSDDEQEIILNFLNDINRVFAGQTTDQNADSCSAETHKR